MTSSISALSATVRVIGPTWSSVKESGNTPRRETRPYVGLSPTIPQALAGLRTLPPVSLPSAIGNSPAAKPEPEPEDEPPGWWSVFHGLRAGAHGRSKLGPPIANSCVESLPSTMAPAPRSRDVHTASVDAILSINSFEWQVVGRPATSMISLMPTGTPWRGPRLRPDPVLAPAAPAP